MRRIGPAPLFFFFRRNSSVSPSPPLPNAGVLSKLLSCDNTQVRTYVHGCLYSLLCRPLMRKVGAEQRGVQGRWLSRLLRGQAALALRPCRRLFPP